MIPAKTVPIFLLVIIGYFQAASALRCPPGFERFGTKCYVFAISVLPWGAAQTACELYGATLAEPRTAEINSWIIGEMKKRRMNAAWLGGNDIITEGTWVWAKGMGKDPIGDFTDWSATNPSNSGGNEDCMHMLNSRGNYKWNDIACTRGYQFICEKRATIPNPWFTT